MKIKLYLLLLLSFCLLHPVNAGKTKMAYGKVKNNVYINSTFGFSVDIPAGWYIQDKEQTEYLMRIGKDFVAGNNKRMKAALKSAEESSANLLTMFQYEMGTPHVVNASFVIIEENLKHAPGIKTEADYMDNVRKLLEGTQMYAYIDKKYEKETINGVDFYSMKFVINREGTDIVQKYYTVLRSRRVFNFLVTFADEEQENILMKSIHSITFK